MTIAYLSSDGVLLCARRCRGNGVLISAPWRPVSANDQIVCPYDRCDGCGIEIRALGTRANLAHAARTRKAVTA